MTQSYNRSSKYTYFKKLNNYDDYDRYTKEREKILNFLNKIRDNNANQHKD